MKVILKCACCGTILDFKFGNYIRKCFCRRDAKYIDGSIVYSHIEAGHTSMLEHSLKHIEIEIEEIKYERKKDNTREMEHNS